MATTTHGIEKATLHLSEQIETRYVWELPVRIWHAFGGLSILVLAATGFWIAWPPFSLQGEASDHFLNGWIHQIHYAAAYVFLFSFLLRCYWFFAGNNYARSGFPFFWRASWWKALIEQMKEYLTLHIETRFIGHNQLGALSYLFSILALGIGEILTGFAMYGESNPDGFWSKLTGWLIPMVGGSFRLHHWHHLFTWAILIFVLIHIYIVMLDTAYLKNGLMASIFTGQKFVRKGDVDAKDWIS